MFVRPFKGGSTLTALGQGIVASRMDSKPDLSNKVTHRLRRCPPLSCLYPVAKDSRRPLSRVYSRAKPRSPKNEATLSLPFHQGWANQLLEQCKHRHAGLFASRAWSCCLGQPIAQNSKLQAYYQDAPSTKGPSPHPTQIPKASLLFLGCPRCCKTTRLNFNHCWSPLSPPLYKNTIKPRPLPFTIFLPQLPPRRGQLIARQLPDHLPARQPAQAKLQKAHICT